MSLNERTSVRYKPLNDRFAIVKHNDDHLAKCRIEDISYTGVCIEIVSGEINENHKNKPLQLLFNVNSQQPLQYKAEIIREDNNKKWYALRFKDDISTHALIKIRGLDSSHYDIAKIDKVSVQSEALQIKTCSGNYFIWTIGLMVPLISGIWTLFIQDQISPSSCSGAMLGMFLLFCMSIFSNLEKTRAIYKREGFVAALDSYLVHGVAPPNYKGWINLKYAYAECASKREAEICPRKISTDSEQACKFIGERLARINEYKRVIPSILDSFISLTSMFYSIIFAVISILSAISITRMLSSPDYNIDAHWTLILLGIGFISGFFVFGRNTNMLIAVIFGAIAIFAVDAAKPDISLSIYTIKIDSIFIKMLVTFIGYIFGSIGNIMISQLIRLRTKEYSFESHFYMWLNVFEKCVFMPNYKISQTLEKNKFGILLDFLVDFIFFKKLYSRKRT